MEVTEYLNSLFVPKLDWSKVICRIENKKIGILYVEESNDKPIIASKNGEGIKEGEIYYRYPGETRKIKQGELKSIIEEGKRKYGVKLLEEMKLVIEAGPNQFGIIDLEQINKYKDKPVYLIGTGSTGEKIELREANKTEASNGIAVKVVNVEGPAKTVRVPEYTNINSEMIIHSFFEGKLPSNYNPKGFLERLPYESSGLIPIYFYIKMSGESKEETIRIFEGTKTTARARSTLIKRLKGTNYNYTTNTNQDLLKKIINGEATPNNFSESDIRQILISIRSVGKDYLTLNWDIIKKTMDYLYDNFYMNSKMRSELRWTVCYLDELFYK